MANSISRESGVGVAGIVSIGLPQVVEIGEQFAVPDAQQRPEERGMAERPRPGHARQTTNACAAQDPVQNGFGLVIGRVRGHDEACSKPPGRFFEKPIAG